MEVRIQERTSELSLANQRLRAEIAERGKVEEALRESENKNIILLEAIPDSMFILSEDGIYHDFRSKNDDLLVIPPDEIIGKKY